ncbi:unnamed protein product [Symbiodinium natans]|uniref:Uncharacterized protein n=1 Tax=Symbiodinium natans TaxID=878477 RepID=A0A812T399_9DINO|nr:unnamed protein product [Symbiodinium natans]
MQYSHNFRRHRHGRKDAAAFHPAAITPRASSTSSEQDVDDQAESDWSSVEAEADDLCCYISLASAHENDTVLGLGLFAHRRTRRQVRLRLPHDVSFSLDYLDVSAFNTGLQTMANRGREPALVSSSRGQLNAWLPLFVDSKHWTRARPYVESAITALSGVPCAGTFPEIALSVCCSLLTQAAVSLSLGHSKVTERAVQMYGDSHRLLLQLAHEWPELQQVAHRRLRLFLHHPESRLRHVTPSLGDLLHCMLIVDDLEWDDLKDAILPEALRRHVWRQECKGFVFGGTSSDGTAASAAGVLEEWDWFAPDACKVVCFIASYVRKVGRPKDASIQDVMAAFDRNNGRLPKAHEEIAFLCKSLQEASLQTVLDVMGTSYSEEFLAETVLWAVRHGSRQWTGPGSRRDAMAEEGLQGPDDLCPLLHRLQDRKSRKNRKSLRARRSGGSKCHWRPKDHPQMPSTPSLQELEEAAYAAYTHLELQNAMLWSWLVFYDAGWAWWGYGW